MNPRLALLVLSVASCSTTAKSGKTGGGGANPPVLSKRLAVTETSGATFAAGDNPAVVAAAIAYPVAADEAPSAPLSLTASDGTGLRLVSLEAAAVIDGPLAFTELTMAFENPRDRVIEGRFAITLPSGAAISRLAMKIDGHWQEAEVVERQKARRAYEDFLHRKQDPALLEKEAGNEFRARVFPIPARGVKEIVVSFSQELPASDASYRLPLRGLSAIQRLEIRALRGIGAAGRPLRYEESRFSRTNYVPDADFELPTASRVGGIASGELALVRVAPKVEIGHAGMKSALLLLDTSASRAAGFGREVARFGELVSALAKRHPGLRIEVATFDNTVGPIYEGPAAGFGNAELNAIRARRPLGASNLEGALRWAGGRDKHERLIVVTDAVATAGGVDAAQLVDAAKALAQIKRIDIVLVGGIHDGDTAIKIVRGTVANDGVVADGAGSVAEIARRIGERTVSGVTVSVPGAEMVWPTQLDGVQPGDERLVYAVLGSKVATSVHVVLSGPISQRVTVPVAQVQRPLLERAIAMARIARLANRRDALPAEASEKRVAMRAEIVKLSTKHRVLSDCTALLVLETEADYARFGIDRRSLADILSVGPRGVRRSSRSALIIARPVDTDKNANLPLNKSKGKKKRLSKLEEKLVVGKSDGSARGAMDFASENDADVDGEERAGSSATDPAPLPQARIVGGRSGASHAAGGLPAPRRRAIAGDRAVRSASTTASTGRAAVRSAADNRNRRDAPGAGGEGTVAAVQVQPREAERALAMKQVGPPPYAGRMAKVMKQLAAGNTEAALLDALAWRSERPGDVMALLALGEAVEARGRKRLAARIYGSIIDLFPARADMRRFAAQRLERLEDAGQSLASDSLQKAVAQRPDHLTGHRQLAYSLVRAGNLGGAFGALEAGLSQRYPAGRFPGGPRILREDLGMVGAAWIAKEPAKRMEILRRMKKLGASYADKPSLRFLLSWETDANDVDFHIFDAKGNHAFYSNPTLASGGHLYQDVTNGYGPECFAIDGVPSEGPYRLQIHYYSRGPMGYGMGELEVLRYDGKGGIRLETRPFVAMNDGAFVDLGMVRW